MSLAILFPHCWVNLTLGDERPGETFECRNCKIPLQEPLLVSPSDPVPVLIPGRSGTIPSTPARARTCPYCGETILPAAKKCKHCGELLDRRLRKEAAPAKWHPGVAAVLSLVIPGAGQ